MKFGVSSLVFLPESLSSSLEKIAEHNFDVWEIVCEGTHYLSPKNIKYLLEVKDKYDVDVVVHAPFSDLNPASMNEKVRKLTIECIRDAIEGAFELDAEIVVVHPGYIPELWSNYKSEILDNNFSTLSEIVEIAEDYGIKIGLENMPNFRGVLGTTPESLLDIIKDIDSKNLGITFDIGHANTVANPSEFVEKLHKIGIGIIHVHIHDNNGYEDEHLRIGEGNINFIDVLEKLKEIDYKGVLSIENKNIRDAVKSKEILKEYLEIVNEKVAEKKKIEE
ncbi:MAG: sugar phosphate isomerase/epimerase [Methanococci archaeon]|nr:sugar phosphate isomerase/epimerase [Methanococci archaeon]